MNFAMHRNCSGLLLNIAIVLCMALALNASAAVKADGKIVAEEYWASKGNVKLWVYRKQLDDGVKDKPLLFLVHGSSYSGKTMFDLTVPNRVDYSFMDHEGYGHSDRTSSISDIQSGVEDLRAAMSVVKKATGKSKAAFFGQSSGALRAARFANFQPESVDKLIVDAFVWTGKDAPTLVQRAKRLPELLKSNVRKVDANFYKSVFTRDHPGAAEPMLGDVVAEAELKYGDTVPNGTYIDMVTKLPLVDPVKVLCPVLIVRAEHDGIATDEDIMGFYARLPNPDKQMSKIAGLAHTAFLGVNRHRFWHAVHAFLTTPPRVDLAAGVAPAAH